LRNLYNALVALAISPAIAVAATASAYAGDGGSDVDSLMVALQAVGKLASKLFALVGGGL